MAESILYLFKFNSEPTMSPELTSSDLQTILLFTVSLA